MNCKVCGKPVRKQGLTTWNFGICQRSKACRAAYARAIHAVKRPPDPPAKCCEVCGKQIGRLQWANAKARFCAAKACQAAAHRIKTAENAVPLRTCAYDGCTAKILARNKTGFCVPHWPYGFTARRRAARAEQNRKPGLRQVANLLSAYEAKRTGQEKAEQAAAKAAKRARQDAYNRAQYERMTAQIEAAKQASTLEEKARALADSPEEEGEMLAALTAHERFKAERAERIRKRELKAARLKAMAGA